MIGNNLAQMWDTRFDPRIKAKKSALTWIVDELYFPDYEKFLQLFENYDKSHKDYGNGYLYYKEDMAYPMDIDPDKSFITFISESCNELPIKLSNFKKSWGVKYMPGAYNGLHNHKPGKQLTAVLFLSDAEKSEEFPLAGNLTTLQPIDHDINYVQHETKAGSCVIMDASVYHGTYPTLNERKVFVCDLEYEIV